MNIIIINISWVTIDILENVFLLIILTFCLFIIIILYIYFIWRYRLALKRTLEAITEQLSKFLLSATTIKLVYFLFLLLSFFLSDNWIDRLSKGFEIVKTLNEIDQKKEK